MIKEQILANVPSETARKTMPYVNISGFAPVCYLLLCNH